jgi:hypothetical protein
MGTNFSANGKSWGYGQSNSGHLSQIGSFPSKQFTQLGISVRLLSEVVDIFDVIGFIRRLGGGFLGRFSFG